MFFLAITAFSPIPSESSLIGLKVLVCQETRFIIGTRLGNLAVSGIIVGKEVCELWSAQFLTGRIPAAQVFVRH